MPHLYLVTRNRITRLVGTEVRRLPDTTSKSASVVAPPIWGSMSRPCVHQRMSYDRNMKTRHTYPGVVGHIEISHGKHGVFIGGNPQGLRSLARLLTFLADVDQDKIPMPKGERDHTHLHPGCQLSKNSMETEVCRLDAKGTGKFPKSTNLHNPKVLARG